jgi:hypothetical protein
VSGRWLLALSLSLGCAHLQQASQPAEVAYREQVLLDVDLTKGSAGPGVVTGGKFEGGWRVTSRQGERIVFDAGRPLANGYLEVRFTMSRPPHQPPSAKIQWVGLYEDASLSQAVSGGDIFYARAGEPGYKFSRIKAYGRKFDKTEWENDVGQLAEWITDDKTVQTVRLEWKGGRANFIDAAGKPHDCPRKLCGGNYPIDRLRYAALGSDRYTDLSLEGIRFVHVKLVELVP